MKDFSDISRALSPLLRNGRVCEALMLLDPIVGNLKSTPFNIVLDLSFEETEIAKNEILRFIQDNGNIRCIYAEMNGFSWNFNSWHFNLFGYTDNRDAHDSHWLSNWEFDSPCTIQLTGMESLQRTYKAYAGGEKFSEAEDLCTLLVILKFQHFIQKCIPETYLDSITFMASSHDFDDILMAAFSPSETT